VPKKSLFLCFCMVNASYLLSNRCFFKPEIVDIQYRNHIYSSLKERCTDMGITNRFKASYQTRSSKNETAWKQETDCDIGCRKIGLDYTKGHKVLDLLSKSNHLLAREIRRCKGIKNIK